MTTPTEDANVLRALKGLASASSSVRLQAALAAGRSPDPRLVDPLIARCETYGALCGWTNCGP